MKTFASLGTHFAAYMLPAATALGCSLFGVSVFAQIRPTETVSANAPLPYDTSEATTWGIGIGGATSQRPYLDAGSKSSALPLLYFENRWVRLIGTNADVKGFRWDLTSSSFLSLDARFRYESNGYEADDSPSLQGMEERKDGIWGGATMAWDSSIARLSAEWMSDLSDHSKGQKFQLQLDKRFRFGRVSISPRIQAQWLDQKYVDYYYGVTSQEARSGRAAYSGKAATTFEAGARVDYLLAPAQSIFVDVSTTRLPDEISQSPIVGRSSISRAVVGYLYRF